MTNPHQETGAIHTKKNKIKKKDNNRALEDRMRDLPEWLDVFKENLEETEVPAPAHVSYDSDSERPTKMVPRTHSIFTHFPKDRNCEECLRTRVTKAPCRLRTGEALPRAEERFW